MGMLKYLAFQSSSSALKWGVPAQVAYKTHFHKHQTKPGS